MAQLAAIATLFMKQKNRGKSFPNSSGLKTFFAMHFATRHRSIEPARKEAAPWAVVFIASPP
jgi:hypothetical protein